MKWAALLERRSLIWFVALALAIGGLVAASRLPSGVYPEVEFPRIVVVARAGDAPPPLAQVELTRPLEAALATVPGVERIRSRTIRGSVELSLQFAPATDMWRAHQLVEARIAEVRSTLPSNVELGVERLTTSSFPILTFNLTGDVDPRVLRETAEFVLKPALSRVRGVGRVEVLGGDVREVEVIIDPARTAALKLSATSIAAAITDFTVLRAVGRFEESHANVTVMLSGEPSQVDDLNDVPIAVGPSGTVVPLSAIAEVRDGHEDRRLRVSGKGGETVLLSIARLPGASTPEVVEQAFAALDAVKHLLPKGSHLDPVYDQSLLVGESIRSVRDAIILGVILCVVVIALFLRDLRAGLVAASAVPLALASSFLPLALLGQSLNLMSLGGLAVSIGLVIDDAIVVVEGIARARERGLAAPEAANDALHALGPALLGTTVTTVIVFLPLIWLEGVVGRFFTALAVTLSSAVMLSLLISVSVVPVATLQWLRDPSPSHGVPRRSAYRRLLQPSLAHPWRTLGSAVALFTLGVLGVFQVQSGFLPTMDEGAFVIDYFLPAGTSLTETDQTALRIEAVLATTPEVESWSRRTGAELGPATATLVNRGDLMVRLKPLSARQREADEVIADVRTQLQAHVPEARLEFVEVLQDVLNDLSGAPRPLELKLFGDDEAGLRQTAVQITQAIQDVPGLVDLYVGFEDPSPELRFRVDAAATARVGMSSDTVSMQLDAALHGAPAGILRRPDRPIGIRVHLPDAVRFDAVRLAETSLVTPAGHVLPISALAAATRAATATQLNRESLRPVVVITGDHEGRDLSSIVKDVQHKLAGLSLPAGVLLEFGGQYEGQQDTQRQLAVVMLFGLMAVSAVLLVQFRRGSLVLVVLASVPLALGGAIDALWATGTPLNASSLMGCVLLVGLVVKNGILLLEQFETGRLAGLDTAAAMLEAGSVRVRPIMMTTVATIAGLAPLALGFGAGADLQRPLAIAVIGGLALSTAVTLFVTPALVMVFARATGARATPLR